MRGSPSGTIGCEKRATAWRTFFTVPWGEKVTVGGAESARGAPACGDQAYQEDHNDACG